MVRENELLQLFSCREYCLERNMLQWSSLLDKVVHQMLFWKKNCISYMQVELWHLLTYYFLETVVVIDMLEYIWVLQREISAFFLYHYCCAGRYSVCSLKMSGKVREKSGNLIMTGACLPWLVIGTQLLLLHIILTIWAHRYLTIFSKNQKTCLLCIICASILVMSLVSGTHP